MDLNSKLVQWMWFNLFPPNSCLCSLSYQLTDSYQLVNGRHIDRRVEIETCFLITNDAWNVSSPSTHPIP